MSVSRPPDAARAALGRLHELTLAEGLRRLCLGLCVIFAVFTVLDAIDLPAPAACVVGGQDIAFALLFGAAYLVLRRRPITACQHLALAACALLATSGPLLTYALAPDTYLLGHLLMVMVGVGSFMLSWRWSVATMAAVLGAGWLVVGMAMDQHEASHWGFLALVAVAISLSIQLTRRGVLARLAVLAAQDEHRTAELDRALGQVHSELTERRIAEEKLARERDAAEQIVETTPAIVLVLDPQGRLLRANRRLEQLSGVLVENAVGEDFFARFVDMSAVAGPPAQHQRIMDTAEGSALVLPLHSADGALLHVEWHWAALVNSGGERVGVLAMGQDITARLAAEREARESHERWLRAQKLEILGTLAGGVAHDVNNTLAAITSLTHLLLEQCEHEGQMRQDLESILQATQRGAALTRNVLAFGRSGTGVEEATHLHDTIAVTASLLERTLPRNVRLALDLAAPRDLVMHDARLFEQALCNLCLNAVDVLPAGGTIAIRTRTTPAQADRLLVEVEDNGTGMEPAVLARIFEPFFTTKPVGHGTGLGLAMVHETVTQMGGRATCASAPGKGTRFAIELPLVTEGATRGDAESAVARPPTPAPVS